MHFSFLYLNPAKIAINVFKMVLTYKDNKTGRDKTEMDTLK